MWDGSPTRRLRRADAPPGHRAEVAQGARRDPRPLLRAALARGAGSGGGALALPLPAPLPRRLRADAAPIPDAGAARGGEAPPARRRAGHRRLLRGRFPEPRLLQRALRPPGGRAPERVPPPHPRLAVWPAAAVHPELLRRGIFAILKKRAPRGAATSARMIQKLSHATVYVLDQDRAKDFYVGK